MGCGGNGGYGDGCGCLGDERVNGSDQGNGGELSNLL